MDSINGISYYLSKC